MRGKQTPHEPVSQSFWFANWHCFFKHVQSAGYAHFVRVSRNFEILNSPVRLTGWFMVKIVCLRHKFEICHSQELRNKYHGELIHNMSGRCRLFYRMKHSSSSSLGSDRFSKQSAPTECVVCDYSIIIIFKFFSSPNLTASLSLTIRRVL